MSTLYVDNLQPNLGSQVEIPNLKPLAGSVVQTVYEESAIAVATTSTSHSTFINATITPKYASSKILISTSGTYYKNNNSSGITGSSFWTMSRNGTTLPDHNWSSGGSTEHYLTYTDGTHGNFYIILPFFSNILDAPASTSALIYRFRVRAAVSGSTHSFYSGLNMTLTEIAQ